MLKITYRLSTTPGIQYCTYFFVQLGTCPRKERFGSGPVDPLFISVRRFRIQKFWFQNSVYNIFRITKLS